MLSNKHSLKDINTSINMIKMCYNFIKTKSKKGKTIAILLKGQWCRFIGKLNLKFKKIETL
jgi:hypothetical protein